MAQITINQQSWTKQQIITVMNKLIAIRDIIAKIGIDNKKLNNRIQDLKKQLDNETLSG